MKSKGNPSVAQLRARAKFTKIMKSGGFKKKKKSTLTKSKPRSRSSVEKTRRRNRELFGLGSASDIDKSLLLNDISELVISTQNKTKIIKSIANRLKI